RACLRGHDRPRGGRRLHAAGLSGLPRRMVSRAHRILQRAPATAIGAIIGPHQGRIHHGVSMTFSQDAWAKNAARYETIRTMPFNEELARGTLSRERFQHYMIQDAHYLIAFGRALAVAGAKADDADGLVQFAHAAEVAVIVERSLHSDFMQQFGVSPEAFAATPLSPACAHYSSYLIATAWSASYPVALAALLPCFWIYAEI